MLLVVGDNGGVGCWLLGIVLVVGDSVVVVVGDSVGCW